MQTYIQDKWFLFQCAVLAGVSLFVLWRDRSRQTQKTTLKKLQAERAASLGYQTQPIYKICLTGGPCGGKSSSLKILRHYFQDKGFTVFAVPQTATMTVMGGASLNVDVMSQSDRIIVEKSMMRTQLYIQNYFIKLAALSDKPTIILYDRGVLDAFAYITKQQANAILYEEEWSMVGLRDQRYDLVIFLVTAADGAEEYYTVTNNLARSEGLQQARAVDRRTVNVYAGHPHVHVISNIAGQTFQQKVDRCIFAIEDYIRPRTSSLSMKKYLVSGVNFPPDIVPQMLEMRIIYLIPEDSDVITSRIIRRGFDHSYVYSHRLTYSNGHQQRRIASKQFIKMAESHKDADLKPLDFTTLTFIYQKQQFNLQTINAGPHTLKFLQLVCRSSQLSRVKLPPFMQYDKDVTDDPSYSQKEICRFNSTYKPQ